MKNKEGFGAEDSPFGRFASLFAATALLALSSLPLARGAELAPAIHIRLYDYARVERRTLMEAKKEATRILGQAGISTAWLGCPLDASELEARPGCEQPLDPTDIVLRFIPASMEKGLPFDHSKVGFAFVTKEGPRGSLAGVFYQRIFTLVRGDDFAVALGLGRAAAHEIGHLLLRSEDHSPRGIMRANWRERDFRNGTEMLSFTPDQAVKMRAEVEDRQAETLASLRDAGSPALSLAAGQ